MKIGILGTADVAFRRFLPALAVCKGFDYAGVASRTPEKGRIFQERYGGKIFDGYGDLLKDSTIGAVYVPLPPALHFEWGKRVLASGKHLLMEKPFTTCLAETEELLALAKEKNLTVHENYMFLYHSQLAKIKGIIASGEIGEPRLLRMTFGFPKRTEGDFRYNRALGGGALLDCGGYPVRLALELLGDSARVVQSSLSRPKGYEIDLYGSAVLENDAGLCTQISFGMDNAYQCRLELWGSKATLIAPRIFTAGPDFKPGLILRTSAGETGVELERDDQFLHSMERFKTGIADPAIREQLSAAIMKQSRLVAAIQKGGIQP